MYYILLTRIIKGKTTHKYGNEIVVYNLKKCLTTIFKSFEKYTSKSKIPKRNKL